LIETPGSDTKLESGRTYDRVSDAGGRAQRSNDVSTMSTRTRSTDLVGCALPVQLAAMGRIGTTELAAAVVAAGGMGMVPSRVEPSAGPYGVNFLVPFAPSLEAAASNTRS
jgi:hypothetical protein